MPFTFTNNRTAVRALLMSLAAGLLTACGGGADEVVQTNVAPVPSVTPLVVVQNTPVPTPEAASDVADLIIWWPEPLAPVDRVDVTDVLARQIEAFGMAEGGDVEIEFRLKRMQDIGGIMPTLRAASAVAPSAVPDITLMRREDLLVAAQSGLIQPLEGVTSTAIVGGLYQVALQLGQIDDQLYGLPYVLDVQHLSYLPPSGQTDSYTGWRFEDVLDRGQPFTFPAARASGVNSTFFIQYLAAGGSLPDASGVLTVNADALRTVYEFYEQAARADLVDESSLDYTNSTDYATQLRSGQIVTAVTRSSLFLSLWSENRRWRAAPLPTASGGSPSMVNGWMWVMTTTNPERQALAARFMNWMMGQDRQREYAEIIYMLPSQDRILRAIGESQPYASVFDNLLSNSIPAVPENTGGAVARAMQIALVDVLTGVRTADEATQYVLSQQGG